jgi:TrmH family RNA methyltransferase
MISKAKIKFVKSLSIKKNRQTAGLFVAEGGRTVEDLLTSPLAVQEIFAVKPWLADRTIPPAMLVHEVSAGELSRLSDLSTAHDAVAVVAMPESRYDADALIKPLVVGLEDLQDPGNLGAILRTCAWFGVGDVLASKSTVDCFNAKVVQATMGAIGRVRVHYHDDLPTSIRDLHKRGKAIYATTMTGTDLYREALVSNALVLFGNEGSGLSRELIELSSKQLCIPRYGAAAESLNVAIAVGIVCGEIRSR